MTTLGPDLMLDAQTHDLDIANGDLSIGVDVAQAVKIRLLFVRGEWFLDVTAGTRYRELVWVKPVSVSLVDAEFRRRILDTLGVGSITRFETEFNAATRQYQITWRATTDADEIGDIESITLGG